MSNVDYRFLPGEYHLPTNVTLQYLHNFMITGSLNNKLMPTVFFIDLQAYLRIVNSTNFSISDIVFKTFDKQYEDNGYGICNVMLSNCFSCKITNVTFLNYGVCGENLGGKSYVSNIVIDFTFRCYDGIYLKYLDDLDFDDHIVTIDKTFMHGNKHCNNELFTGIIIIFPVKAVNYMTFIISNSQFDNMAQSVIHIDVGLGGINNTIWIKDCKSNILATTILLL